MSPSRAPFASLAASFNNVSINSPTRAGKDIGYKTALHKSKVISVASTGGATGTTRKQRHPSPSKVGPRPNLHSSEDYTGPISSLSRRSSPVKQVTSLSLGGGIGRSGVVSHDFEPPAESTRRSPSKKGKHVSHNGDTTTHGSAWLRSAHSPAV